MLVRIQPSALGLFRWCRGRHRTLRRSRPWFESRSGYSERPAGVPDSTAVFETARRGSIPRRGTLHPRGVADGMRPCEGRGSGSTPDEDSWRKKGTGVRGQKNHLLSERRSRRHNGGVSDPCPLSPHVYLSSDAAVASGARRPVLW
jgi:hypothetical protein